MSKLAVPVSPFVVAEYVWIDASGTPRSKSRVLTKKVVKSIKELPNWNFDGSSTGQAPGEDSEVIIKPCAMYKDPFRGAPHILVLCDCYDPKGNAIPTNSRFWAKTIFDQDKGLKSEPWYGIEQEYTLFKDGRPLGWPKSKARSFGGPTKQLGYPGPQGPYYCAAGADVSFGRDIVEEHLVLCLEAGLNVSGINGEVMPGQWEFQVGPCVGIDAGDQLTMARYLLHRVCEKHGVVASFEPKPIPGDWNGAGCHTNFSTKKMRASKGYKKAILPAIEKLAEKHSEHIAVYGQDNDLRLTGKHETASIDKFSYGVANRGASVRIPNATAQEGKGYLEDRRPASNMDPYMVTGMIFQTTVVGAKKKGGVLSMLRFSRGPRSSLKKTLGSK